jgi:nicotinamidase-related amidase
MWVAFLLEELVLKKVLFLLILMFFSQFSFAGMLNHTASEQRALMIIDMQDAYIEMATNWESPSNVEKLNQLLASQLEAIESAKRQQIPIILVEMKGPETFGKGDKTLKVIIDGIGDYEKSKVLYKDADGILWDHNTYKNEVQRYLQDQEIGVLVIMGLHGRGCVYQSISSSLNEQYTVAAYSPGITDLINARHIYPFRISEQYDYWKDCNQPNENCSVREIENIEELNSYFLTSFN